MPKTDVVIYAETDGSVPLLEWLDEMPAKGQDKGMAKVERLGELGHELRRPEADILRDKIHELRIGFQGINYRVLYFFHGQQAVLSHGCTKEGRVPDREIDEAVRRRRCFEEDPMRHSYRE